MLHRPSMKESHEAARGAAGVRDVMHPVHATVAPEESVGRALQKMQMFQTSLLVVVRGGDVIGVVGERALMRVRASARSPATVRDFMSKAIEPVAVTTPLDSALARLRERNLDALAVVDDRGIVGTFALVPLPSRPPRSERGT
jgi:CBS domain-containing protein